MRYTYLLIIIFCCRGLLEAQSTEMLNNNSTVQLSKRRVRSMQQNNLVEKDGIVKLDSIIEFTYQDNDTWDQPIAKIQFSYQEQELLNECITSNWNDTESEWQKFKKLSYKYYPRNDYEIISKANWSDDSWNEYEKVELNFNSKGLLEQSLLLKLEELTDRWEAIEKWQFSYNSSGSPQRDSLYVWHRDMQNWVLSEKLEYEYQVNHVHYIFSSIVNDKSGSWELNEKTWYLYDNNWWRLYGIYNYTMDQGEWQILTREGVLYDVSGNIKGHTSVNLQADNIEVYKEVCTFDYNTNIEDILLPEHGFIEDEYKHHLLQKKELYTYNKDTKQDEKYKEIVFYYSEIGEPTAIDDVKSTNAITVYPNPAHDFVMFTHLNDSGDSKLTIYDLHGKVMLKTFFSKNVSVNIQDLSSGIYVYRIENQKTCSIGKLIVR